MTKAKNQEARKGYWYEYYHLKIKSDPLKIYARRKRAWEQKYGGTYPYGPDNIPYRRRKD